MFEVVVGLIGSLIIVSVIIVIVFVATVDMNNGVVSNIGVTYIDITSDWSGNWCLVYHIFNRYFFWMVEYK